MTLHTYPDIEQRSEEWFAQRCGIVTASVVGQLVTPSTLKPAANDKARGVVNSLVAERITGYVEPSYLSSDMMRGIEDEPRARDKYAEHYAPVAEAGFMRRDDWGFSIGFSPDGLVGDDGIVEIKSRLQKIQLATILSDSVPSENMAQIQTGLLVSGRAWCDYISYSGGMPLYVKRVLPDPKWHTAIVAAVDAFELTARDMVTRYAEATANLHPTERPINLDEMVI